MNPIVTAFASGLIGVWVLWCLCEAALLTLKRVTDDRG